MNLQKNKTFLAASTLLIVTFFIIIFVLIDLVDTGFFVGPLRFSHWMVLIGTFFIAIYTPMFYFLKRRYPNRLKSMQIISSQSKHNKNSILKDIFNQ